MRRRDVIWLPAMLVMCAIMVASGLQACNFDLDSVQRPGVNSGGNGGSGGTGGTSGSGGSGGMSGTGGSGATGGSGGSGATGGSGGTSGSGGIGGSGGSIDAPICGTISEPCCNGFCSSGACVGGICVSCLPDGYACSTVPCCSNFCTTSGTCGTSGTGGSGGIGGSGGFDAGSDGPTTCTPQGGSCSIAAVLSDPHSGGTSGCCTGLVCINNVCSADLCAATVCQVGYFCCPCDGICKDQNCLSCCMTCTF